MPGYVEQTMPILYDFDFEVVERVPFEPVHNYTQPDFLVKMDKILISTYLNTSGENHEKGTGGWVAQKELFSPINNGH